MSVNSVQALFPDPASASSAGKGTAKTQSASPGAVFETLLSTAGESLSQGDAGKNEKGLLLEGVLPESSAAVPGVLSPGLVELAWTFWIGNGEEAPTKDVLADPSQEEEEDVSCEEEAGADALRDGAPESALSCLANGMDVAEIVAVPTAPGGVEVTSEHLLEEKFPVVPSALVPENQPVVPVEEQYRDGMAAVVAPDGHVACAEEAVLSQAGHLGEGDDAADKDAPGVVSLEEGSQKAEAADGENAASLKKGIPLSKENDASGTPRSVAASFREGFVNNLSEDALSGAVESKETPVPVSKSTLENISRTVTEKAVAEDALPRNVAVTERSLLPDGSVPNEARPKSDEGAGKSASHELGQAAALEVPEEHAETEQRSGDAFAGGREGQGARNTAMSSASAGRETAFSSFLDGGASSGISGPARSVPGPLPGEGTSLPLQGRGLAALPEGMTEVVRVIATEEGHRARIIVDPPALGRVDVTVQTTGNGMEAVLRVDNEALRQTLLGQLDQLRQALAQQGITVGQLSVDVRQQEEQQHSQSDSGKNRRTNRLSGVEDGVSDEDEERRTVRLDLERGLLHWIA
ncbi:flagellar hook-length control protein FliK [Aminiphilus sp.]|uniref:flagellar hook-length control protein FliK n=1 Tax=Aminiphilus sp. TaxID=1872488 RepID=UPI00260DFE0E|nr:flagellar hook-length control protein FliK [Aminiphilus sp.]